MKTLHQSGSYKCLFPQVSGSALEAVLLNTAGGVTGGDEFVFSGCAKTGTSLTITTQACERIYKAQPAQIGKIRSRLRVEANAQMAWLPQETILFNNSALDRELGIELAPEGSLLMVEPLVFGRPAMGEKLTDIRFRDRIDIRRAGKPLFLDAFLLTGDAHAHLAKPFIADGAGASAMVLLVSKSAPAHLPVLQSMLDDDGGVSLIKSDVLVMRLLGKDSFTLRQKLLPVLQLLNNAALPRCWMM